MKDIIGSPSSIENSDPSMNPAAAGGRGIDGIIEHDQGDGQWKSFYVFVIPIMSLNTFNSFNFTIVARLTVKYREYFIISCQPPFLLWLSSVVLKL